MIGQRVRRRKDPRFITGHGQYVDNLELPGARHAVSHLGVPHIDMPANGERGWRAIQDACPRA